MLDFYEEKSIGDDGSCWHY